MLEESDIRKNHSFRIVVEGSCLLVPRIEGSVDGEDYLGGHDARLLVSCSLPNSSPPSHQFKLKKF